MSNRESFEDVMHALRTKAYEARESDRPWMPSLPTLELEGIIDRLQAAHDRETRNHSLAHMRESRERYAEEGELRAAFHHGYEAGKRAMDADHKAVALRLMGLDLDGDSHTMLSRIAYAIYPYATGWTKESCEVLAERIVHLLGGDGIGHDNACECGGAGCARAGDSDGRQAEDVMRSDFVNCGNPYREGGAVLDSSVITQYDVLGNERHKAVRELRKMSVCSFMGAHGFRDGLAAALDVPKDNAPYSDAKLCELICDRLIHLLGGDQPTLSDLYGIWEERDQSNLTKTADFAKLDTESDIQLTENAEDHQIGQDDGTCPDGVPATSITSELREFATDPLLGYASQEQHVDRITTIADRIDEQFDRCCEMWERVATEYVLKYVELQAQLDESDAAIKNYRERLESFDESERLREELMVERDELSHDVEMWRDRAEDMRMERDELQAKLDELDASGATELYRLLKSTLGEAKCIADRLNAHNGELRKTEAKLDLMRRQRDLYYGDCQMYLDLLRDVAKDCRELQEACLYAKFERDAWASKLDMILQGGDRDGSFIQDWMSGKGYVKRVKEMADGER